MKKGWSTVFLVLALSLLVTGCASEQKSSEKKKIKEDSREVFAMDTYMTLKAYGENCSEALDEAVGEIQRLDQMFTTGSKESEIGILNENGSEILSGEGRYLFSVSKEIFDRTEGAFDITVYPLMQEWGFTDQKYQVPSKEKIQELVKNVGMEKISYDEESGLISLPEGVKIDFGGIAKGYTSQRVMDIFQKYQLTGGLVSLGGNVQTYGTKPDGSKFVVAIEDPFGNEDYVGTLNITDKTVITSGGYERFFEQDGVTYHHILNPETGYPAESGLKSVTIVNENGTMADGLSTALFVMGKEKAIQYWKNYGGSNSFDFILVEDNGNVVISSGLADSFEADRDVDIVK